MIDFLYSNRYDLHINTDIWPFRFEAVLIREKENWVLKYLQFSLPFSRFLEGKTEAASIIK